ncbi:MAG: bifunctional DNA-binding transcriptional regulator/O6-methylguanine-DNA methyltransferase Ada [Myxococcus sp.]|nr:bifunctional DNA-binding transcriptional regulator/O6-methylguanine-DNA methyltransferase Ada [Myxococcus sp.]
MSASFAAAPPPRRATRAEVPPAVAFRSNEKRWSAVCARLAEADGHFVFAVKTTGVFCRPSCGARRPSRANVAFFESPDAAQRAGFRACKRCKPLETSLAARRQEWVLRLCRRIEAGASPTSLAELAGEAGLSPFHVQRTFKAVTGVTPRQYAGLARAKRLQAALGAEATVTDALYAAGYGSSSRLYAESTARLGTTPRRFREGRPETAVHYALAACSLGQVLVAATHRGVCWVTLGDDGAALVTALRARFPLAAPGRRDAAFAKVVRRVVGAIETPSAGAALPLDVQGTAFQQRVWRAISQIPPGETRSYLELATALGAPQSVRAVAQACGANPTAVLVPCHRVVRSDGALSGYRWGVARKAQLLARERSQQRRATAPR